MPANPFAQERREYFRVKAWVRLRIRQVVGDPTVDGDADPVAAFEDLVGAAELYRSELSPYGRMFLDKFMALADALVGQVQALPESSRGWLAMDGIYADLSEGGLGFAMREAPALGTWVDLHFRLPPMISSVPFQVRSEVVHLRAHPDNQTWVGVRFDDVDDVMQERLGRAVLDLQRIARREADPDRR